MDHRVFSSLVVQLPAGRLSTSQADKQAHSKDESFHPPHAPDLIVWPESTEEVSLVLQWANERGLPVTAWGGGTSLEGNPIPAQGGIVLDMTRMDRIVEVLADDFLARVQPGIIGDELNKQLSRYGLFFPALPGSSNVATIGGMIANNAGGMIAARYGVVGDNVLALEVVLADGTILRTGSHSLKSVAGYDLISLFVGSEGTLGIITEATLRLRGLPPGRLVMLASFDDVQNAGDAARDLVGSGIQLAALELMDAEFVKLANQAKGLNWRIAPTLLIELHGIPQGLAIDAALAETLCRDHGCATFERATATHDQNRLWEARRGVRPAVRTLLPNQGVLAGDIGVPLSAIPGLIRKAQELGREHSTRIVTYGHAGDGNFHIWALYELSDPASQERAREVNEALIRYALSVGGTCAAEHGIGLGKQKFLLLEHPSSTPIMLAIKRLLDPKGILNPGKIFPPGLDVT